MVEIKGKLRPDPPKMLDITIKSLPDGIKKSDIVKLGQVFKDHESWYLIKLKNGETLKINQSNVVYDRFDPAPENEPIWLEFV